MMPRPVSVAPDGGALYFVPVSDLLRLDQVRALQLRSPNYVGVMRGIDDLSIDEKFVIIKRRLGWEKADCATLSRIFHCHPTTIASICNQYRKQREG